MAKLSFDATKVAPQQPMDPVPKGWYPVVITASDVVPTKKDPKNGIRVELEVQIIDGEYKGRKAWDGINKKNANPKAQQIGEEQLSAICHATGVFKMTDTAELHNKPFEIKLGYEEDRVDENDTKKTYDARNVFKGFRPLEGGAASAPAAGTPAAPPKWAAKPAEAAAPAKPAAPGKPAAPAKPTPPPTEPEPEVPGGEQAERPFYVFIDNDSVEKTGAEVATMLGQGMPDDTPVMATDDEAGGWKTAADYEIAPYSPPAEPAAPTPPAKPKGPAAPTGGKTPPWKAAKK